MAEVPEEKFSSPLKQIRTFQGDVASALQKQRESLVSIQQQEAARSVAADAARETFVTHKKREFFLLILGSFVLIAVGLFGARLTYNEFLRKTAPPVVVAPESRLISSNSSAEIDLTGATRDLLLPKIAEAGTNVSPNEIRHIILDTTANNFLKILESRASGSLVRALDPVFMLGFSGQNPFIIFKLSSFENAFAGMLTWEENLGQDLGPIFTTQENLKSIGPESVFKDIVFKNKDVRMLSASTTPVLLYSFFDNKMLIITSSLETMQILINRLTQELLVH